MNRSPRPLKRLIATGLALALQGRVRSIVILAAAASLTAVVVHAEAVAAQNALDTHRHLVRSGGYLFAIEQADTVTGGLGDASSTPDGVVDRAVCEAMVERPGVEASMSVGEVAASTVVAAGDEPLRLLAVSPGAAAVLASIDQPFAADGVTIGRARFTTLGLANRDWLTLRAPDRTIRTVDAAIADLAVIRRGYASAALVVAPATGESQACIVAVDPTRSDDAAALPAAFGRLDLVVTRVLDGAELVEPAWLVHQRRQSAEYWWMAGVLLCPLIALSNWTRRAEIGLLRVLGQSAGELRFLLVVEGGVLVGVGACVGTVIGRLVAGPLDPSSAGYGWVAAWLAVSAQLLAVIVVAVLAPDRRPVDRLRDR